MSRRLIAAGLGAAACLAYGTFVEPHRYRVRRARVPVLPAGSTPIRVLHLSDVHLTARNRSRAAFLSSLAGLEPDVVVSTGDHLSSADGIEPLGASLGRLLSRPGVFVTSSNDYRGSRPINPLAYLWRTTSASHQHRAELLPTGHLREVLASGGWQDVTTSRARIEVCGLSLEFRGTDDAHHDLDDYSLVAGPPVPGTDLAIGVTHAPYRRLLDAMTLDGLPLILAGHTHGGQVCLPCHGALTTNCDLETSRARGLSRQSAGHHESWVNVSAGLGSSPTTPFRFACLPEVSLLTLAPARMDDADELG